MVINDFKVSLDPTLGIMLVEHPNKSVTLENILKVKKLIEKSMPTKYYYAILKRIPGYFFSYDLRDNSVIVCGRMDKTETVNETKEYARHTICKS